MRPREKEKERVKETLAQILAEPAETVRRRERSALEDLLRTRNNRVVLFGCGNLGRQTASALKEIEITPLAFSDNNKARWGTDVDGVQVLPPAKVAQLYGREATFLVT